MLSTLIGKIVGVLAAIRFDDQPVPRANKIEDLLLVADRMLPAEAIPPQPAAAQR